MTAIRTSFQLAGFALLTFLVFSGPALFRHTTILILVPMLPLVLVFFVAPAAKTALHESASLLVSFTWWQGLWLLLFLSGLVFRMRAAQDIDKSPLDIWAVYRAGLVLIVGLVLSARLVSDRTRWLGSLFSGTLGILAIYSLVSLTSTLWSVRPLWTSYKSIEYLVNIATISAIVVSVRSIRDYQKLMNWTWTLLGLLVGSAWIGAIIDPADGLYSSGERIGPLTMRLEGVMPSLDANSIGEFCAILALVALNRILNEPQAKRNRGWYVALVSASLVTLIFSQTRSAMVAFVIGLAVLLFVMRRTVLIVAYAWISTLSAVIVLAFTNVGRTFYQFLLRGESVQTVQGLSGRLVLWQASYDAFLHRPWVGYGGYAGSRFVVLPTIGLQAQTNASTSVASSVLSTYVDSALDLGVWGPLLITIILIGAASSLIKIARSRYMAASDRPLAAEMLAVLSVVIIRSFVTENIVGHASLAFLTVIGFVAVAQRQERAAMRVQVRTVR